MIVLVGEVFSSGYAPKEAYYAVMEVAKSSINFNLAANAEEETLKNLFKDKFKIGTSVSPNEFNVGSDFIKKHFNSITPEKELKPDAIINSFNFNVYYLFNFSYGLGYFFSLFFLIS